jgi:hypothetical protein
VDRCPELLDLEIFFGSSATARCGNDGGWYYDHLTFRRSDPDETVVVTMEPAEGAVSVLYARAGTEIFNISLQHVSALDIESSAGVQVLVGRVESPNMEQLFKLRIKPEFRFSLATSLPSFG